MFPKVRADGGIRIFPIIVCICFTIYFGLMLLASSIAGCESRETEHDDRTREAATLDRHVQAAICNWLQVPKVMPKKPSQRLVNIH